MEAGDVRGGRPDDLPLDLTCQARLDELTTERAEQCVRDGGQAHRTQPTQVGDGMAQQRVAPEATEEGRVIVVESEHEPQPLDGDLRSGPKDDRAVHSLPGRAALAARERRGHDALANDASCVSAAQ